MIQMEMSVIFKLNLTLMARSLDSKLLIHGALVLIMTKVGLLVQLR
jgi:hypothetical protein